MKKLSILLLAIFYIGISNINAQNDVSTEKATNIEATQEIKKCAKTGKICNETCKNKKDGTCCNGNKSKSSCSKSKKGSFNFNKNSATYSSKSSCSKSASKKCCKKKAKKTCGEDCTKACCTKVEDENKEAEDKTDE